MGIKKATSMGGTSDVMDDIDDAASLAQVSNVVKPPASKDVLSFKDIDEGHGGINQIVQAKDGAAGSTAMTMHSSSAPTPEDMGFM